MEILSFEVSPQIPTLDVQIMTSHALPQRVLYPCTVNCMLSRSVPHLADTGNCVQHTCIHTQCMMLYSITGQYSVLTVPWSNCKYCHDIFEECLKKTTKYKSGYCTGCLMYEPEAPPCLSAHWRQSFVIWYWYCAPPTLPDKLALLCRPWPCAFFGSPLMTLNQVKDFHEISYEHKDTVDNP